MTDARAAPVLARRLVTVGGHARMNTVCLRRCLGDGSFQMPAEAVPPLRRRAPTGPDGSSFNWRSRLGELEALSKERLEREQDVEVTRHARADAPKRNH